MMRAPGICIEQGILWLHGDIQFATVTEVMASLDLLDFSGIRQINCSKITSYDSSTIALLVHLIRLLRRQSLSLPISGIDPGIMGLASLYGVDTLLANRQKKEKAGIDQLADQHQFPE